MYSEAAKLTGRPEVPLEEHKNAVWRAPWPCDHFSCGRGASFFPSETSSSTDLMSVGTMAPFNAFSGISTRYTCALEMPAADAASNAVGRRVAHVNSALHLTALSCLVSSLDEYDGLIGDEIPEKRCAAHEIVIVSIFFFLYAHMSESKEIVAKSICKSIPY